MAPITLATDPSIDPLRGFLPVHVDMLRRVRQAPVDIYVQHERKSTPTLYCRAGLSLENQQLLGLADAGIRDVYVRSGEFQDFGRTCSSRSKRSRRRRRFPQPIVLPRCNWPSPSRSSTPSG